MNLEAKKALYCFVTVEVLNNKGKRPSWFSRRHWYRKNALLEYNTSWVWLEKRKDDMYIVSTLAGMYDNKNVLVFKIIDHDKRKYDVILFDINDKVAEEYKNLTLKFLEHFKLAI
jgi:hypothetical protein